MSANPEVSLQGRRVLVTGGGQGVGHGLAVAFGRAGAEVLVNDLRVERCDQVVDEIRATGARRNRFRST